MSEPEDRHPATPATGAATTNTTTAEKSGDDGSLRPPPMVDDGSGDYDPQRVAFVTVGATAGFRPLLREVLSDAFIDQLVALGYTRLVVQCGPDSQFAAECLPREEPESDEAKKKKKETAAERARRERRNKLVRDITIFEYTSTKMKRWMRLARPGIGRDGTPRDYGVIISHAGPSSPSLSLSRTPEGVCSEGD